MVTEEEARARVRAGYGPRFGMWEFDRGWVFWLEAEEAVDTARPPERVGSSRGVVDRDTGELFFYPPMPVEDVAQRHRWRVQAYQRFPRDVAHALLQAGWFPGRAVPDSELDAFAELVPMLGEAGAARPGFALHEAARAALREFGSLRVRLPVPDSPAPPRLPNGWPMVTVFFPPAARPSTFSLLDGLDDDLELVVSPFAAVHPDRYEDIAMDADGRVFSVSVYDGDAYLLADTVDQAISYLVRGGGMPDVPAFLVVPGGLLAEVSVTGTSMELTGRLRDRSGALVLKEMGDEQAGDEQTGNEQAGDRQAGGQSAGPRAQP